MPDILPQGYRRPTPEEARRMAAAGEQNVNNAAIDDLTGDIVDILPAPTSNPLGFAARQIGSSLLPMAGMGLASAATTALAPGPAKLLSLPVGVGAAMLTGAGQELALKKLAQSDPAGFIANQLRQREADVQAHPIASMLTSALAGPALGIGGIGVNASKALAAKQAAANVGIADVQHMIQKGTFNPLDIDPTEAITAGVAGAITSRPSARYNNFLRSKIPENLRTSAIAEHLYPQMEPQARNLPNEPQVDVSNARTVVSPEEIASRVATFSSDQFTPSYLKKHFGEDPVIKIIAGFKDQKVPFDLPDVQRAYDLSNTVGNNPSKAVQTIAAEKLAQMHGGAAVKDPLVANALASREAVPEKPAAQAGTDIQSLERDMRLVDLYEMTPGQLKADGGKDALLVRRAKLAETPERPVTLPLLRELFAGKDIIQTPKAPALEEAIIAVKKGKETSEDEQTTQAVPRSVVIPPEPPTGRTSPSPVPDIVAQEQPAGLEPTKELPTAPTAQDEFSIGQVIVLKNGTKAKVLAISPTGAITLKPEKGRTFFTNAQALKDVLAAKQDINKVAPAIVEPAQPVVESKVEAPPTPASKPVATKTEVEAKLAASIARSAELEAERTRSIIASLIEQGMTEEQAFAAVTGKPMASKPVASKTPKTKPIETKPIETKSEKPAPHIKVITPEGVKEPAISTKSPLIGMEHILSNGEKTTIVDVIGNKVKWRAVNPGPNGAIKEGFVYEQGMPMTPEAFLAAKEAQKKSSEITPPSSRRSESGSIINPAEALKKPVEKARTFVSGVAQLLRDKVKSGFSTDKPISGDMLYGRLINKANRAEVEELNKAGLKEFLKTPRTTEELADWTEANGPQVDAVTYSMEGKVSEAKKEYDRMTHEWYERLGQQDKQRIENAIAYERHGRPVDYENELAAMGSENGKLAQDYLHYKKIVEEGPKGLKATSYYKKVSALLAEKNARDLEHDNQTINWLAKQPQHIRDEVEARLEKAAGGARMEDVLKQHKQDAYAKGSERENEVTSNNPEHYIERNYDGSYYVNQNPHVGIADTRIPGKRYATKDEAIQAARKLHGLLSEADNLAINKYVDATLKQEESGAMPWWTRSAIEARKGGLEAPTNVQRVDVVIPLKGEEDTKALATARVRPDIYTNKAKKESGMLWPQDNLHENLPNTLGWAMIQYKTGPKGEKIAVIAEAQSRWGQTKRANEPIDIKKDPQGGETEYLIYARDKDRKPYEISASSPEKAMEYAQDEWHRDYPDHPLLRDYNRLILKAAIEQARKEGATHIMVSDAETAMMTEMHDLQPQPAQWGRYDTYEEAVKSKDAVYEQHGIEASIDTSGDGYVVTSTPTEAEIGQAKGMRLNYDTILPKIAEELTGSKGERVSLGEHKNAFSTPNQLRENLIFKNPDGTLKIDVSGRLYKIPPEPQEYTLFGKDKYQAPVEPSALSKGMQSAAARGSQTGSISLEPLKKAKDFLKRGALSADIRLKNDGIPLHYYAAKKFQAMRQEQSLQQGPQAYVYQLNKVSSPADKEAVHAFLMAKDDGDPLPVLTPKQQDLASGIDRLTKQTFNVSKAWVRDIGPNGEEYTRPREMQPNFVIRNELSQRAREVMADPYAPENKADYQRYKMDFIARAVTKGDLSPDAAEQVFQRLKPPVLASNDIPSPEFYGSRYAAGIGLPASMRANIFDALPHYISKTYTDAGYHNQIENDPIMAKALGLMTNGRGQPIPASTKLNGEEIEFNSLGGHPDVRAIMRDYTGLIDPNSQSFERAYRLISAPAISTWSALRDIANSPTVWAELAGPGEMATTGSKAIMDSFRPKVGERGMNVGALRAYRNSGVTVNDAVGGFMNWATDNIHRITGTEGLQLMLKRGNYSFADALTAKKIAEGDTQFLRHWGPVEWRELMTTPEGQNKLRDYIAKRVTDNFVGSYNADELPNWLLRGSGNPLKLPFMMSRWSIGRFNRWYENVYQPAKSGDIAPLIRSLVATLAISSPLINWMKEKLTKQKPRELTWEEYLNLGGQDTAYTVFSKAATVGYAGILTDVAQAAIMKSKNEAPYGFTNPVIEAGTDAVERIGQLFQAVHEGKADFSEGLTVIGLQFLKDQVQVYRVLAEHPETGNREEKIARRLGYMPSKGTAISSRLNPYSEQQMYQREDIEGIRGKIEHGLSQGVLPQGPTSAMRNSLGVVEGKIVPRAYYEFLKQAQGEEAAVAALKRDQEETRRRMGIYSQAMSGAGWRN